METSSTQFEPNDNQQHFLRVCQDNAYSKGIAACCRDAEIHRDTYYKWTLDLGFVAWWREQADRWFARQLPKVQGAILRSAAGQNLPGSRDRKLFLERYDKQYTPRHRQELQVSGKLDLSTMTQEELDAMEHAVTSESA